MSLQKTLLVVDDNEINLEMLSSYLSRAGYRVLVAADGESALEQASIARPDLVLMDVLLPGMNGFDAARALHRQKETATTPVIFLTALSRTADKMEGFRAGGVDYLTKPLQFDEVIARVRVHLELRELQDEVERRNALLEDQDVRRNQMLSLIAHDIHAPLAELHRGLEHLGTLDPNELLFEQIRGELADRSGRIVDFLASLLEWGKIQVRSDVLDTQEFALADAVSAVEAMLHGRLSAKDIVIQKDVPRDLAVALNRTAVEMVLNNILSNAIKFSPRGTDIGLNAGVSAGLVNLVIWDRGVGMDQDTVDRLFTNGGRVQRPGTEGEKGSGLGILLTRDLVTRLGGSLSVDSEPGAGTRVTVSLPRPGEAQSQT